ncbi:MAG: hypothetical protein ACI92I_000129 [Acidimicrobiales bacterium]|jgi:hypothetical protein
MLKKPKSNTLKRFQEKPRRRNPIGEPSDSQGVAKANFVRLIGSLACGPIHGTVLRRLQPK